MQYVWGGTISMSRRPEQKAHASLWTFGPEGSSERKGTVMERYWVKVEKVILAKPNNEGSKWKHLG